MNCSIDVEIIQHLKSNLSQEEVLNLLQKSEWKDISLVPGSVTVLNTNSILGEHVHSVNVCEWSQEMEEKVFDKSKIKYCYFVYRLYPEGPGIESMDAGDDEDISAAHHWILPCAEFYGLWENLIYEKPIKENLLSYVETTMLFSMNEVDSKIISWNRIVLLHGPPGTGKTSLCKALAQKLTIRLSDQFTHGELVEINSHSLFSKWFSESGKLVMKMFSKLQEMINDPKAFVCVLIDEIESLTHARQSCLSGNEPSDSIRAVNAVLTQIDHIRRYPNVLILTTSNITDAIDLAFVDRADIKQYIGLPSCYAIYNIYHSCIIELKKKGIITFSINLMRIELLRLSTIESPSFKVSQQLLTISRESEGLSGRSLRKIPFLAHVFFIQKAKATLEEFLEAMHKAVLKQIADDQDFKKN